MDNEIIFGSKAQNANVLTVGGSDSEVNGLSGSLLLSEDASSVVIDTDGALRAGYRELLEQNGYNVLSLDFDDTASTANTFDPLEQMNSSDDIAKMAGRLVGEEGDKFSRGTEDMLFRACLAYIMEDGKGIERSVNGVKRLVAMFDPDALERDESCSIIKVFEQHRDFYKERTGKDSEAYEQFRKLLKISGKSIRAALMYALTDLNALDTPALRKMMSQSDFDLLSIGREKTVLFVNVSDIDRTRDLAVRLCLELVIERLCGYAASLPEKRLPVPVRFILRGFGTTVVIPGFERTLSGLNSRGISAVLAVRSLAQLEQGYGRGAGTVLANCPVKLYLGGSDPDTARFFAELTNKPAEKLLNMPPRTCCLVRNGEEAVFGKTVMPERANER